MFDRLKRVLVKSFIGTITLGYLLAQAILYFVNIFPSLAAGWVAGGTAFAASRLEVALRQAVSFIVLLLIWYGLLRWLYFTPIKEEKSRLANLE